MISPFSLASGTLRCIISTSTNLKWKNELERYNEILNRCSYCLGMVSTLKENSLLNTNVL
jgi:hypothetical protein